jgi:O-antigen/teichoic acid export membrane protein
MWMNPGELIRRLAASRNARQSMLFFLSQAGNALLGILVYGMLARMLTVEGFGAYTFVTSFVTFAINFFDFGLSSSSMRLMALAEPGRASRERSAALLVASCVVGALFAVFFFLSSFVIERYWPGHLGWLFVMLAPLAFVYPVFEILLAIGQGSNRIGFLSLLHLAPRVLLCGALLSLKLFGDATVLQSLVATMGTMIVTSAVAIAYLRPSARRMREELHVARNEMREFGRDVYIGRVVDGFTNGTDRLMITYSHGLAVHGFYSIAKTLSTPITMMSRSIATSSYQRFAMEDRIPRKILIANLIWCFGLGAFLLVVCETVVPLLFTQRYAVALSVLPWLVCAATMQGLNTPYHAFLAARRQGRSVKIIAVSSSLANVALTVALVPSFSMIGAAIAWIASAVLNIGMNLHYYRKYLAAPMNGHPA